MTKSLKIAYVARHGNTGTDDTEGHIAFSLEKLGHEVVRIPQTATTLVSHNYDLLLFHHWYEVDAGYLSSLPMKKVAWTFDKVWNGRDRYIYKIAPLVDHIFMTDGTWAERAKLPNVRILRQGIGDRDVSRGTPRPDRWKAKIAFTGSLYGKRVEWAKALENRFSGQFQVFSDVFNRDLYDLCASVPIFVAPKYPSDNLYCSNRPFLIMGSGGFLIHPRLKCLTDEYTEGVHFEGYADERELYEKIAYYLKHEDEAMKIAEAGFQKTHADYSFTNRCQKLLEEIQPLSNTGTRE